VLETKQGQTVPVVNTLSIESVIAAQQAWQEAARTSDEAAASAATAAFDGLIAATEALVRNLGALGFPDIPGRIAPEPRVRQRVATLERHVGGRVPPVLAEFWSRVGGISLVDLENYAHVPFFDTHRLRGRSEFCDGIHVDRCSASWLRFALDDYNDLRDDPDLAPPDAYMLSLSPDGYHKDNISGGDPYGVNVDDGWLAPWRNFEWPRRRPLSVPSGECDFLGYLRSALLECAGFPGLYGLASFEPMRTRLLQGVCVF
jgi:hypothetical protein